jgi:hypothetical protein
MEYDIFWRRAERKKQIARRKMMSFTDHDGALRPHFSMGIHACIDQGSNVQVVIFQFWNYEPNRTKYAQYLFGV